MKIIDCWQGGFPRRNISQGRLIKKKSAAVVSGLKWIRPAQMLARREELELGPFQ